MKRAFSFGDKSIEAAVGRVNAIRNIAVIGAGTMGQGIVIDLLKKTDLSVVLIDVSDAALETARSRFNALWRRDISAGRMRESDAEALDVRVTYTKDYEALRNTSVIWEVASEQSKVKASIFGLIEKTVDPMNVDAIFSNTSSHTTAELAELFSSESLRERFLTVHGYYPFEANRLIDVMKGKYASQATFQFGIVFADQLLEKSVIALPGDHHGYITDPIFQAMGAIVAWDVRTARDIMERGGLWDLFTANPFQVLDQTGHMPFTESSRHFGQGLPATDRLGGLYLRNERHYPAWIENLEKQNRIGIASSERKGFFEWSDGDRPKPTAVLDPASGEYVPIMEVSRAEYWSYYEARERDRLAGRIKSAESLVHVACAGDSGGRAFRRYAIPLCLYVLDLIQDGIATPAQVNISTRAGLRFKVGLIGLIDTMIAHLTLDGVIELIRRARDENADDPHIAEMLDVDGMAGPRRGKPSLLLEMKRRNFTHLLGYGSYYGTPVTELDLATGRYRASYPDIKFYRPATKDRVACIVFNNPLRGNVFNKAVIDQLGHAVGEVLSLHRKGQCGAVMFSAAGSGMRMLGADAREFNRGWFDRDQGYAPLSESEAAASSRNAVGLFRLIQKSPVASIGVFGEKWGGGAEFTYFLDLRYDVITHGLVFDPLERKLEWREKNTYNQPELDYAILPGFGAAGELKRLGLGDATIFELFDQGLTAGRAHQIGLSNAVFDDEITALRYGYERARQMAKDAPYSRALFKRELARGADDESLAAETGETFNPEKNPFVRTGLLALLDRGARAPRMDYSCAGVQLPGWEYPTDCPSTGLPPTGRSTNGEAGK